MPAKNLSNEPTTQSEEHRKLLVCNQETIGKNLNDSVAKKIHRYVTLLSSWTKRRSLVSGSQCTKLMFRHVIDSLALRPFFEVGGVAQLPRGTKVVDVGSGAGLPGLVLSIALPNLNVFSAEPMAHKATFQRTVADKLNLRNFTVWQDSEVLGSTAVQVMVSRAFARTSEAAKVTASLMPKDLLLVLLKGSYQNLGVKILLCCAGLRYASVIRYKIPTLNRRRHVVLVKIRSLMV